MRHRPPFVREATAHFVKNDKHYLITSGTTGYYPNPSEVAVAETWHGPYTVLGNPHPDDATRTSYHSQVSSVFKVPGRKDLYIALADRWVPQGTDTLDYNVYGPVVEMLSNPNAHKDKIPYDVLASMPKTDTRVADYVWLPIRFDGDMAYIDWKDEWRVEDYPEE